MPARFIPAGAGNTRGKGISPLYMAVYPRWRGEHYQQAWFLDRARGLSPLARGTRTRLAPGRLGSRFIPAGAGNTAPAIPLPMHPTVYPRWRGEHPFSSDDEETPSGLSPLARGTQLQIMLNRRGRRFIPAGAGNTRPESDRIQPGKVYPRWRGEHAYFLPSCNSAYGLSPLARGTQTSSRPE